MKQCHFILLLGVIFSIIQRGQAQPSSSADPTAAILPPSPSAAALEKYIDQTVDYASGLPNNSVPLYTMNFRGIQVPISLSYHAGGVRVDDMASNVGLGWTLHAGGAITRTVYGKADEDTNGFIAKGNQVPGSNSVPYPGIQYDNMKLFADGSWDGQPDLFSFNFNGYSGKFFFDTTGAFLIHSVQDLKISYQKCTSCPPAILPGSIIEFTILTPDGLKYVFGNTGAYEYSKMISNGCKIKDYTQPIVTAWYLKTIHNPKTNGIFTFNYSSNQIQYDQSYNETFSYPQSYPSPCGSSSSQVCVSVKTDYGVILNSIWAGNETVNFTTSAGRTDLNGLSGNTQINGLNIQVNTTTILEYTFHQSIVTSTDAVQPLVSALSKNRLYLDSIRVPIIQKTTKFTYHNRTLLPPRLSFKQDHYGYYNSNTLSQLTPPPAEDVATLNYIKTFFSSFGKPNRAVDTTRCKYGVLNKITYPTGGSVSYDFESNMVPVCSNVTKKVDLSATASKTYINAPASQITYFNIDINQVVNLAYTINMVGFRCQGAYIKLSSPAGVVLFQKGGCGQMDVPFSETGTYPITLPPGNNYKLEAGVFTTGEVATITANYQNDQTSFVINTPIGGLRVRTITLDDGDADQSNNIIKVYKYEVSSPPGNCAGKSSGVQLGRNPKYNLTEELISTGVGCNYTLCLFTRLSSSSIYNLNGGSGGLVNYQEVYEWYGSNAEYGKKYVKYFITQDGSPIMGPNVHNAFINTPTVDFSFKNGKILEEKIYNNSNAILHEKLYVYDFNQAIRKKSIRAIAAQRLFTLPCFSSSTPHEEFAISFYEMYSQWVHLNSVTERTYTPGTANYVEIVNTNEYESSGKHILPVKLKVTNSDGVVYITKNKYSNEYDTLSVNSPEINAIRYLSRINCIQEPIEAIRLVQKPGGNELAVSGNLFVYDTLFNQANKRRIYRLETTTPIAGYTMSANSSGSLSFNTNLKLLYTLSKYDNMGNLLEYNRQHDQTNSILWGDNQQLPVAKVLNATQMECAFTSFETSETTQGGWTIPSPATHVKYVHDTTAYTGKGYFGPASAQVISKTNVPNGKYILSYFCKNVANVNNSATTNSTKQMAVPHGWNYVQKTITLPVTGTLNITVSTDIDELRLYPADALLSGYSYDRNSRNLMAMSSTDGTKTQYEYDSYQRLKTIRNADGDYQQLFLYHFVSTGGGKNYIHTRNILKANVRNETVARNLTGTDVSDQYQYLDGLGRIIQSSQVKFSPGQNDVVDFEIYNNQGLVLNDYLPYTASTNNGAFRTTTVSDQANFYTGLTGFGYTASTFETSPLFRVTTIAPPGSNFRTHPQLKSYAVNTSADNVRNFAATGNYAANLLTKLVETDENNHVTTTFADKLGRQVMMDNNGARTYYLYDDFGNQLAVIPPVAAALFSGNSSFMVGSASFNSANQIFKYTYNAAQLMVTKQIPGVNGSYSYTYDRLDRLVLEMDAKAFKKFTKYDILSRPILSGHYYGTSGPNGSELLYENSIDSLQFYSITQSFPTGSNNIYSVFYYDDYDFDKNNTDNETYTVPSASAAYFPAAAYPGVRGKTTGVLHVLLPGGVPTKDSVWVYSFYDNKGRVIHTHKKHTMGGADLSWNQYHFADWLLRARKQHSVTINSVLKSYVLNERFTYDHVGRQKKAYHQVGDSGTEVNVSSKAYNERQLLSVDTLGLNQAVDYQYNIRGWLSDINNTAACSGSNDLFAMSLYYDQNNTALGIGTGQYNGNINWVRWQTGANCMVNGTTRNKGAYGYSYDNLDRLIKAQYGEYNSSNTHLPASDNRYTVDSIKYDMDGNITRIRRQGYTGSNAWGMIDDLTFTYGGTVPNRLSAVAEASSLSLGFKKPNGAGTGYTYDSNGNRNADSYQNITSIDHLFLNLPLRVTYSGGNYLDWTYDAAGNKWLKKVNNGGVISEKRYLDNLEYTGSALEAIYFAGGRVVPEGAGYAYQYIIRDHLGNSRVMFKDTVGGPKIVQENHYYPFGMNLDGVFIGSNHKYQYNGKELPDDLGYIQYDYGARWYDPSVGRYTGVDPMAHKMPAWSPYSFCFNNPLIYVDPNGLYPIYIITRSYAPFSTFGPGNAWYGDNRGHTLNKGASYRTLASINYDTETQKTGAFGGRSRSHTVDGTKDAYSDTYIKDRSKGNNIDVHSYGNNAAQTGSWDIDQFTKLSVTTEGSIKKDHILNVSGTISGDDFPNQESMIYDSKGNTLWLGNFETSGDRQSGPVTDLPFQNEGDVNININLRVKVNKDGVFQGVMTKGKDGKETMITIGDWNKKFKSDDNK